MPSQFEIHTVAQQFNRVQDEIAVLRGMVRELLAHPTDEDVPVGEQPSTEAPEPRAPQHFDGRRWVPGPSPETNVEGLDVPPGQG